MKVVSISKRMHRVYIDGRPDGPIFASRESALDCLPDTIHEEFDGMECEWSGHELVGGA